MYFYHQRMRAHFLLPTLHSSLLSRRFFALLFLLTRLSRRSPLSKPVTFLLLSRMQSTTQPIFFFEAQFFAFLFTCLRARCLILRCRKFSCLASTSEERFARLSLAMKEPSHKHLLSPRPRPPLPPLQLPVSLSHSHPRLRRC